MKKTTILLLIAALCLCILAACETPAQRRAALGGAVIGGAAGGLIGKDVKSTAIGAGAGAVGGALIAPRDREYRDRHPERHYPR
jgi:osmotically inducible lipoprotein OsmB